MQSLLKALEPRFFSTNQIIWFRGLVGHDFSLTPRRSPVRARAKPRCLSFRRRLHFFDLFTQFTWFRGLVGHDFSLTPRRSPVRARAKPRCLLFFFGRLACLNFGSFAWGECWPPRGRRFARAGSNIGIAAFFFFNYHDEPRVTEQLPAQIRHLRHFPGSVADRHAVDLYLHGVYESRTLRWPLWSGRKAHANACELIMTRIRIAEVSQERLEPGASGHGLRALRPSVASSMSKVVEAVVPLIACLSFLSFLLRRRSSP